MDQKKPPNRKVESSGFFSWVKPALRSRRTIKTWLRCCVVVAATLILMVADKPSRTMGQAAFFCVLIAVMIPPTLAFSVFLIASTTLLLGMLLGWAWGSAAMASALSVRSATLLAQQQQKLQALLTPNLPTNLQIRLQTFHGIFLDPRSSAVYGAFLFVGTFSLGAMRAYLPNLTLLSIFGTIVLDVICTTGPLLPKANYTLANLFLIPSTFYIAVAFAGLVFIFPESLSHVWLSSLLETFWAPTLDLLHLQSEVLEAKPSDHETWAEMNARGMELRANLINGTEALTGQIKLINIDISIGRLGPTDLKKINAELKSIMFRTAGLQSFQMSVNDTNVSEHKVVMEAFNRADDTPRSPNRFQDLQQKVKEREMRHGHDLDSLVPILAASSADLRNSSEAAVVTVINWLQDCNTNRWREIFSRSNPAKSEERHEKLVNELRKLEDTLYEFRNVQRVKLVKPFEKFFDPQTRMLLKHADLFTARSLYICFVFIDTLDAFAECIVKLLKIIVDIDSQRPHAKLWFPGRISNVQETITKTEFKGAAGPLSMGTADDPVSFQGPESAEDDDETKLEPDDFSEKERLFAEPPKRRNPDALPPTTAFGKFFVRLAGIFRFFKSPQGIFALRSGIVSVALWIPAVCETSAWFYYENKGLWALIMAQTGLAMYAGDQIANFVIRLGGTLLGLVIGMAVWYIGAGLGHGNPYTMVVVTTIALAPFLFIRVAGPPVQVVMWMMVSITIVLVTGYSWIDANVPVLSNTGVGYVLGWRRALLVIIGFAAAFIIMLFPNPMSSRVLVRKSLAAIIGETGNIFGGEVEAFLAEEQRARNGVNDKKQFSGGDQADDHKLSPKERRGRKIANRVTAVYIRLRDLRPSLTTARLEPQLSGTWPHAQYEQLLLLQLRVLGSLGLLITSFAKLDSKWCSALVHRTPFMNPNFLSDVFTTITILSNALMSGQALPAYLPKLRDRLVYHEFHSGKRSANPSLPLLRTISEQKTGFDSDSSSSSYKADDEIAGPANVDGSSIGIELDELTLDVLLHEQLPAHSTAVVALSSLISRIDEMIDIVEGLCGQPTFHGYEALQRDYLEREERAVGGGGFVDARQ